MTANSHQGQALVPPSFWERMILVGGPPRSGTSFIIRSLNLHPSVVALIDDHVFECWGLYRYRDRSGLVTELRQGKLGPDQVRQKLSAHLCRDRELLGAADSAETTSFPIIAEPKYAGHHPRSAPGANLVRHRLPLAALSRDCYLCLKSPEISFVLPQLAECLPPSRFVLVYRSALETAESMYRKGRMVKRIQVYHARWRRECDPYGRLVPPPGVPRKWHELWGEVSDFQRCVVYTAAYLEALAAGAAQIERGRVFLYRHDWLRSHPANIFQALARFLNVPQDGFNAAHEQLKSERISIERALCDEYEQVAQALELNAIMKDLQTLEESIGK